MWSGEDVLALFRGELAYIYACKVPSPRGHTVHVGHGFLL